MRLKKVTQTAVGAAVIIGSLAVGVGYAQADYAPSATDVVGFGGDTPQQPLDFGADGDTLGDLGYNAGNNPNKLVSIDATADANGRNAFEKNSATNLNPTVVYRAGTSPVQRIRSTGNGYTAFDAGHRHPAHAELPPGRHGSDRRPAEPPRRRRTSVRCTSSSSAPTA